MEYPMFTVLRFLLPLLFFNAGEGGGEGDPPKDGEKGKEPPEVKFDDAQQKRVNDLIAAERKSTEDRVKAALKAEQDAKADKETKDRERAEQETKGQYESAKASLTQERDTLAGERDALKTENDALTGYFKTEYEQSLKDLPEVIKAFAPPDTASYIEKSEWLTKAKEQAAKVEKKPVVRGSGFDPKANDGDEFDIDKETAKVRSRYRA
jgi:hypothetical protein